MIRGKTPEEILQVAADLIQDVTGDYFKVVVKRDGDKIVEYALELQGRAWIVRSERGYLTRKIGRRHWAWTSNPANAYQFKRRCDAQVVVNASRNGYIGLEPDLNIRRMPNFRIEEVTLPLCKE